MDIIFRREYNINSSQNISFRQFCENFFTFFEELKKVNNINIRKKKVNDKNNQIILIIPYGADKIKIYNKFNQKNKYGLFIGKDAIEKVLIKLGYKEIKKNFINSIFRILINYCFINNISFFWNISMLNLDILIYYVNLSKKYDFTTKIYIIKKDMVNNYILYYYNIYQQIHKENIELKNIDILLYIKDYLNIYRLINQKRDNKSFSYISNEIELIIMNYDDNCETKAYMEEIKIKIYDLIKKLRLIEKKIFPPSIFQQNINKLIAAINIIKKIIFQEKKNQRLTDIDEFCELYKKESELKLKIEYSTDDYVFLDDAYKYESIFFLSREKLELLSKKIFNSNEYHNKIFNLSIEDINKIKNYQSSNECPKSLKNSIIFANEEEKINYQVGVENDNLIFIKDKIIIDTTNEYFNKFGQNLIQEKSILSCFIIDRNNNLFIFPFKKAVMHHSFITKDQILNKLAGMLYVKGGKICYLENISGHYKPEAKQFDLFFEKLKIMSKNNEIYNLFHHNFQIEKSKFSNNNIDTLNIKDYGLKLINIDDESADIIRRRIKNKYFKNKIEI